MYHPLYHPLKDMLCCSLSHCYSFLNISCWSNTYPELLYERWISIFFSWPYVYWNWGTGIDSVCTERKVIYWLVIWDSTCPFDLSLDGAAVIVLDLLFFTPDSLYLHLWHWLGIPVNPSGWDWQVMPCTGNYLQEFLLVHELVHAILLYSHIRFYYFPYR